MSEKDITDVLIEMKAISIQLKRLLSDWESEKDHRVELNRRVLSLEADKIVRDTTISNFWMLIKILGVLNVGGVIAFLVMIFKYLNK